MYHSITFTRVSDSLSYNTWSAWALIPTSRPVFAPPPLRKKYVEVPGADTVIDLTEAAKHYPVFGNRTGTLEFIVDTERKKDRNTLHESIKSFLNGQSVRAVLEDDPGYFYEGRFFLEEWRCEPHWSVVKLRYNLKPYKLRINSAAEDWLWDPFNFDTGIIQTGYFDNLEVYGTDTFSFSEIGLFGRMPVCPTFTIVSENNTGINVYMHNHELGLTAETRFLNGINRDPRYVFSDISGSNTIDLVMDGIGTVSIDFRSGGL